jgi:uncharacterized protein
MAGKFLETHFTPDVLDAQRRYYGIGAAPIPPQPERDPLTPDELAFIAARDSFYMATTTSDGWPYIQHRGGPPGFLKSVGPNTLAFADFKGNRQLLSTGNLTGDDRAALFLMDYPRRERLKILGHVRVLDARENPEWVERVAAPAERRLVERIFVVDVVGFDWNCPKYITPRYTEAEVREVITPLQDRIAALEKRIAELGGA